MWFKKRPEIRGNCINHGFRRNCFGFSGALIKFSFLPVSPPLCRISLSWREKQYSSATTIEQASTLVMRVCSLPNDLILQWHCEDGTAIWHFLPSDDIARALLPGLYRDPNPYCSFPMLFLTDFSQIIQIVQCLFIVTVTMYYQTNCLSKIKSQCCLKSR